MENAPSVDTVHQAVNVLYKGQDTVSKEKASIWLGEFQNSVKKQDFFIPLCLRYCSLGRLKLYCRYYCLCLALCVGTI